MGEKFKPVQRCSFCQKVIGGHTCDNKSGLCNHCLGDVLRRVKVRVDKIILKLEDWHNQVLVVEYKKSIEHPVSFSKLIESLK